MYKEDLKEMMSKALAGISEEDVAQIETHLFRIYDENQNGFIDFHEFMTVFCIFTGEESVSVLEKVFRIFDVDNTGTISKDEMLILVKDIHALIKDDIKDYSDEEVALRAFEEMDANKDGGVTREEFVSAVMDHKKFSQYLAMKIFDMFG
jgi:Ca2+-binding EF-hand superfamily protein